MPDFESDSDDDVELLSNTNKVASNVYNKVTLAEAHLSNSGEENIIVLTQQMSRMNIMKKNSH